MTIQIKFLNDRMDVIRMEEVRLRKDGSFFKWLTDDIKAWVSKPGRSVNIMGLSGLQCENKEAVKDGKEK